LHPTELARRAQDARLRRERIIDRVCGACGNKCCHQMTMMGSQDLRRLLKGMHLDQRLDRRLRAGLRQRAEELQADLEAVEKVTALLEAADLDERSADLNELHGHCQKWREFVQFLRSDFEPSMDEMRRLLHFSAIRSNTLNCLRRFPGGHSALVATSPPGASWRWSGRRLAPPRCLFYLDIEGCLAGDFKPAKCANFFCAGDPNLLAEMRAAMGFDDFVVSNFAVISLERLLHHLQLELRLGTEFIEPKTVLGVSDGALGKIERALGDAGAEVKVERLGSHAMRSAAEVEATLAELRPGAARIEVYDSLDGNVLYELALALDRIRLRDEHHCLVVAARDFRPAPMPHPMWDDQMMSQPLGAIDMYVVSNTRWGVVKAQ